MRILMIAALMLGGCASMNERQLGSGEWRAENINGLPVIANTAVTLRLEDDRVSGNASCNNYSGSYELSSPQQIRFGTLATTRMACPEPVMDQEKRYLSILQGASGYSFYGNGDFSLIAADGRAIRFERD